MKRKRIAGIFAALLAGSALSAAEPLLHWDFRNGVRKGDTIRFASRGRVRDAVAVVKANGQPEKADGRLVCGPEISPRAWGFGKLTGSSATVDISFLLHAQPSRKMTLFSYVENAWGRAWFGIYITADSRIGALVNISNPGEQKKFQMETPAVALPPNMVHTVRVTLVSGGMGQIYLDGKLLKEESGALCFSDLRQALPSQYYPFATLGYSCHRNRIDETFDGVITEVILSDEAKEATPDGKAGADKVSGAQDSRMDANLLLKETASAPVIDGQPDEPCWETAEWSEPFLVLGAMSKDVNGLWESADSKFVQAASRTAMLYDSHALYVAVRSPFPSGMTPKAEKKTGEDIWTDDCIEFFLYPESPAGFYYQLLANANGAWQGFKYSLNGRQEPWNPEGVRVAASLHSGHFDIEVAIPFELLGCEAPEAGSLWRGNCAREGKTCGGLSTWAAVGTSFLAPDRFGKFIFGSRNAFFAKTVHRLEEQMSHLPAPAVEAEKTLSELKKELSESGEKRENWLPLHNRIRRLENQMTQAANEGKSHLVWRIDPWKNFGPDIKIPFETKEMGSVNLETAKGARAIAPFMVSNLTDRALMTNLMFLPDAKSEALTDKIRFREAAFIELNGGKMIPDPIFELPIGAMLRVEPNRTAMVWMDVDTSNLTPGTYSGTVRLYPSFSGFEQKEFKLHLRVSPVDISHVFVRTWAYGYRSPDLSGLEEYGFNTINPIPTQFYPTFDAEGKPEFPHLEKMIRGLEENGIPHEEMFLLLYLEFAQWADRKTDEGKLVKFLEPEWKKLVARDLLFLRDWLNSKGFKYDQYAFYPTDEPGHDPAVPGTKAWYAFEGGKFLRSIDPNFRLMENPHMLKDGRQKLYFEMFDILEPFYPQLNRRLIEEYRDSGREIWTYSIFEKSVTPERYRHLFWENLDAGFEGPATFYDLFAVSGQDGFNSYDSNEKHEKKVVADYGAAYRNLRTRQVTPSRRLEAWYLGLTDFKLARFCRLKLEERKKAGLNTEAEERKLAGIIQEGFRAGGDMESAGKQLLSLAEELLK